MDNDVSSFGKQIISAVEKVLLGQRNAVEAACCCFFAGGHLLIEDAPGTGKTTLARALAKAAGGVFQRVQCTSDLLPADITGVSIWDADSKTFKFQRGPVFCNILLADEINRATPKTQSALLEAMSEKSISVDGAPMLLPSPFMVIATENEQEHHGTYPLPESQLDRFLMRLSMGYPDLDAERKIISRKSVSDPVEQVEPVLKEGDAGRIVDAVDEIHVDKSIVDYILTIVKRTRSSDLLALGAGPRGGMALHRAARALALIRGRDYCLADDVKALAEPVLAHRIIPASDVFGVSRTADSASRIVRDILNEVEIPT
jgi:MoxR-like ATPase